MSTQFCTESRSWKNLKPRRNGDASEERTDRDETCLQVIRHLHCAVYIHSYASTDTDVMLEQFLWDNTHYFLNAPNDNTSLTVTLRFNSAV